MTYRAADYGDVVLTGPGQSHLSEKRLRVAAVREARRADLIGDDLPRIPLERLLEGLQIGTWRDSATE